METLNTTGFSRPMAESHPLEIRFLFGGQVTDKQIWNQFSQPYLPDGDHIKFLLPSRRPRGQWQTFIAVEMQPSSASSFCAPYVYYRSKKWISLVWSELFSTHPCCFFSITFIIFTALEVDCSVIHYSIFIDQLVYDARHLHIFLPPSVKRLLPFLSFQSFPCPPQVPTCNH